MTNSTVDRDDKLSALTGVVERRLLNSVVTEDKESYLTVSVVIWNLFRMTGTTPGNDLSMDIFVAGNFVTNVTLYALSLDNLSTAADMLSDAAKIKLALWVTMAE